MRVLRHTAAMCFVAGALFLAMTALELFYFRQISGGLPSLDLRAGGFTAEQGMAWLTALGPRGSEIVIVWHYLTFDLVFPALFALAMASLVLLLARRLPGLASVPERVLAGAALALAAPYALADYAQNLAVARILSDPLSANPESLALASKLVVAKFALCAIPIAAIAVLAIFGWRAAPNKKENSP